MARALSLGIAVIMTLVLLSPAADAAGTYVGCAGSLAAAEQCAQSVGGSLPSTPPATITTPASPSTEGESPASSSVPQGVAGCASSPAAAEQCAAQAGGAASSGQATTQMAACARITPLNLVSCLQVLAEAKGVALPAACAATGTAGQSAALIACLQAIAVCPVQSSAGSSAASAETAAGTQQYGSIVAELRGLAGRDLAYLCGPHVSQASPDPMWPGGRVTLTGRNLGTSGTAFWQMASGSPVPMTIVSWTPSLVVVRVPDSAPAGVGMVVLQTAGGKAEVTEHLNPGLIFGPPLPDGRVPVTVPSDHLTYFASQTVTARLQKLAGSRLGSFESALAAHGITGLRNGRVESAAVSRQPVSGSAGAAGGGRSAPPSPVAPKVTPEGKGTAATSTGAATENTATTSCPVLSPVTEYGPGHEPYSTLVSSVQYNIPSTTVDGETLAAGAAYADAYGDPNSGTVTDGDWAAGVAAARVDGLLQVQYRSHACGAEPDHVIVQMKVIMAQRTDSISAEGASCSPLMATVMVKPQFSNPSWQQQTLASCFSSLSGSVASFPEDELAAQLSDSLQTVSKAVDTSLELYSDYDTAATIMGVVGATPQVATFSWSGKLQRGEMLTVEAGPSAVIGDAGLGEAVNVVDAVVLVRIIDITHLTAIGAYSGDAYRPLTFDPVAVDDTGPGAVTGTAPGLPVYTCPRPTPVPALGQEADGITLAVTPGFHAYLSNLLHPFEPYAGPNRFQVANLSLEIRSEPGNPWRIGGSEFDSSCRGGRNGDCAQGRVRAVNFPVPGGEGGWGSGVSAGDRH